MPWYDQFKQENIYVHTDEEHNKFWSAIIDEKTFKATIRWGRLGTQGQSQTKDFSGMYAASSFVEGKITEKRRKGYRKIDKTTFDKLCVEAAIVGTQNKCSQLQWVEILDPVSLSLKPCDELRLQDPACNPGIMVDVETRKPYGGRTHFHLLFMFDKSIDLGTKQIITKASPIYEMTAKVEEAIGRSLTAT